MALPLLAHNPVAMNARVRSFAPGSDETSRQPINTANGSTPISTRGDLDLVIEQAYRQIFFHAFKVDRDPVLESQLKSGQITIRDFIRSLLLSRKFRDDFYRCNSNYRLVEQMVGRVLGRPVHGDQERIAYSILIAQYGLPALVDALLDSDEYLEAFGYDTVPFQRSRVLPGRATGERPFNQQAPRYDAYWRSVSADRAPAGTSPWFGTARRPAWLADAPAPWARRLWQNIVASGGFVLTGFLLWTMAAMLSTGWGGR
jgi:phycobilisome rod-core linker protein